MTVVDLHEAARPAAAPAVPGDSPDDLAAAAWTAAADAAAAGRRMSGAELGNLYGRSERWGRERLAELRDADGSPAAAAAARDARQPAAPAAGNGSRQPTLPATGARAPAAPVAGSPVRSVAGNGNGSAAGSGSRQRQPATQHERQPAARTAAGNGSAAARPAAGKRHPAAPAAARMPWLDQAIILVVALVAAAASYGHMYEVALLAGEPVWIARAWPITVDGLALAALRRGEEGRRWLYFGLAVSVAANVVAQYPEFAQTIGPAISGFPPIALAGTHRLLLHGRRTDG